MTNLPFNLATPEALTGTSGTYHKYAESSDGNKLYLQLTTGPCVGRKDGQTYNAVGLLVRILFTGDDPKAPEHFEVREKKAYKKVGTEDDVYATQMNKMLFPVCTLNVGSEGLMSQMALHLEALAELLTPLLSENSMEASTDLMTIFEALNPALLMPVVTFQPPASMKTWKESVDEIQAAAKAGYKAKSEGGDSDPE